MFSLTDEQSRAVGHAGSHVLIVAGAGTGKTTTLAARLARLVERGVAPERILLLTFSRRAAAELLHKAEVHCGHDTGRRVWAGTFHAVANRLLRTHGPALGIDASFTVLDAADSADLLALVRAELTAHHPERPVSRRQAKKDTMATILSRVVNTATSLSTVLDRDFPWCKEEHAQLKETFEGYVARKRAAQVLDYDDLLLCWMALLRSPLARVLAAQFDHVLLDEYQDTNALQADILEALARGGAVLTAVGDDAQAIYGFRNATQRNILDFPARFGAEMFVLEQNHRSTPSILATTNMLMAEAEERHPKQLWSARSDGPRPALVGCYDESSQSAAVCTSVLEHLERGIALRDQAVLFRAAHHSDLLELELTARRIPYVKFGGLRFLQAAHVKDLVCCLRLVLNPLDELAWFRVLQLLEGIGPATARRLAGRAGSLRPDDLPQGGGPLLDTLAAARRLALGAAVDRVRAWLEPEIDRRYANAAARIADLEQLALAAERSASLERFLADLTLDPPTSSSELAGPPLRDEDWLTLSTIHSAKGGEWEVVHVLNVSDGCIPSDMATGDSEQIEEERRLLYVAMTRARGHLACYFPLRYHHSAGRGRLDDRHSYAQMSRFLTNSVLTTMDRAGRVAEEPDPPEQRHLLAPIAQVDTLLMSLLD